MRVKHIIFMLEQNYDLEDELFITWWDYEYFQDQTSLKSFQKSVRNWDKWGDGIDLYDTQIPNYLITTEEE